MHFKSLNTRYLVRIKFVRIIINCKFLTTFVTDWTLEQPKELKGVTRGKVGKEIKELPNET